MEYSPFSPDWQSVKRIARYSTVVGAILLFSTLLVSAKPAFSQRPSGKERQYSAKEVFALCKNGIVSIKTDKGTGTGFLVGTGGIVATCHHVVEGATSIEITSSSGEVLTLRKIGINKPGDAALILVNEPKITPLQVTNTNSLSSGDPVYVIGNPLGFLNQSITSGILSGKRQEGDIKLLQITAAISPGSSGSPVLNNQGRVAGFVSFTFTRGQSLNMAVSSAELIKVLDRGFRTVEDFCKENSSRSLPEVSEPAGRRTAPASGNSGYDTETGEGINKIEASKAYSNLISDIASSYIRWTVDYNKAMTTTADSSERTRLVIHGAKDFSESADIDRICRFIPSFYEPKVGDSLLAMRRCSGDLADAEFNYINELASGQQDRIDSSYERLKGEHSRFFKAMSSLFASIASQKWINKEALWNNLPDPTKAFFDKQVSRFGMLPDPDLNDLAFIASPGRISQFKRGDQIVGIADRRMTSEEKTKTWGDVVRVLNQFRQKNETTISIRVQRGNQEFVYDIDLESQ
jgi:S1-C subfamily serine protease